MSDDHETREELLAAMQKTDMERLEKRVQELEVHRGQWRRSAARLQDERDELLSTLERARQMLAENRCATALGIIEDRLQWATPCVGAERVK